MHAWVGSGQQRSTREGTFWGAGATVQLKLEQRLPAAKTLSFFVKAHGQIFVAD